MKKIIAAAAFAACLSAPAFAQETAPDGSKAFGFEPYVGVLGGYDSYRRSSEFGTVPGRGKMNGALIEGVAGANIPLGAFFVGAEGSAAKGFKDIDWEYGARARAGVRAGESGMIYLSGGYEWVRGDKGFGRHSDWIYGVGLEVGPKSIGLGGVTGSAGPRLRLQVDSYNKFDSFRPMAGLVFHL
jgi:opacity protein-like surface antigen